MEINLELFDKICRVCLIQSVELKSLFTNIDGDGRNLLEILAFTANIDVKIEDSLPKQVCRACESIMCKADAFKRRCLESETILHNVYRNTNEVTEKTKCIQNYSIKDEKTDLKEKLCEYSTLVSPNPSNSGSHYDLNKKNIDLPICSTSLSLNKFSQEFSDKGEQTVKKETLSIIEEENQYLDHFDDDHFDSIPLDSLKKNQEVKTVNKKIGTRYECYCHTLFSDKDEYNSHLKEKKCNAYKMLKSNKSKHKIQCTKCDKEFTSANGWKYHQNIHREDSPILLQNTDSNKDTSSNNKTETFQCSFCLRKFKNKVSLSVHVQRHEETNSIKHVCEICKREFKYKAYLENHVLAVHSRTNGFTCDICMQSFLNKEALQTHKKSHESERKHRCSVCNKAFQMLCTLKEHMRTHTGEKPFLCSQCGKGFSQKTNLAQHTRRHQGLKPFKCESCEKRFVSKGELDAHTRKHSGAHPFVCDDCGNGFTTSSALVKHRRIHTGERPYQCDLCPMRFAASGTLKNHRRTHTGERPFQCSYCEKAFVQRNDLISHIRCHTGERPYICNQCGQSFRKASGLKAHVKMHIKNPIVGVNAILTSMHCMEQ
ncbi:unnamed protein product [Arctia plantaginis]|uniref:Uncharacterized protein n=1 Tax=Arctia plantaginis TaxID=874455 RepID=A0A8S1A8I6_ARCPL|nr:unnamed protein product [Arctia plantaginis]